MTRILVTNDDGVHAPGILALVQAMRSIGEVTVSAPKRNQSASGHKKTLFQEVEVIPTTMEDGYPAFSVDGSPADCIAFLALGIDKNWPPDIVVSGVNRGPNMGQDITYSGTVTAALEASIHGIPAVAVSLDNHDANDVEDYRVAAQIALQVTKKLLVKQLPPFTILNINVPNAKEVKGIRIVRQGIRKYLDELAVNEAGTHYRIVGPYPEGDVDEEGTDLWAVDNGYASLTPLHLDMTAHRFLADVSAWDIDLES